MSSNSQRYGGCSLPFAAPPPFRLRGAGVCRGPGDGDAAVLVLEIVFIEAVYALGDDHVVAVAVPLIAGDVELEDVPRPHELDQHTRGVVGQYIRSSPSGVAW